MSSKIGDYFINISDYFIKIGDYFIKIRYYFVKIGDYTPAGSPGAAGGGGRGLPEAKVAFRVHETMVWHTPADLPDLPDPADPADRRSEVRPRPSLPHAPGVRMAVVKQTPSNK